MTAEPRELPTYDHDHLERCFGGLDRFVRANLDVIIPRASVSFPLRPQGDYLFTGSVTDARCYGSTHWFLGVRSALGGGEVAARVPP